MGLISPGWENLLDFLQLPQVLSTYDGDLRDPLWWPQERPVPMRVARGPLGNPLSSMLGPKTLCGVGAGTGGFLWKFLSMYPNKNLPVFVLCFFSLLTFSGKSQFRALFFCI